MPLNTVYSYLKGLLNGLQIPGTAGVLEAFITPPDPETEPTPKAYVWGGSADETRVATPRAPETGDLTQAGWKKQDHQVDVWLVWFSDEETDSPDMDSAFPAVLDWMAAVLRKSANPVKTTDPLNGQDSELLDIGERMTYEVYPPRAVADQRVLRYDARFMLYVEEYFQS